MRFAIFTHVEHRKLEGSYFAYAPYVREMNLWFEVLNSEFPAQNPGYQVEVVAPLDREGKISGGSISYTNTDISFSEIPSFDLLSFGAVLFSILKIPLISFRMIKAMRRADHLHLRCPGNIGLLASMLQVFFPRKMKTAKYAGNWDPEAKQPWTYKLQRWILSNTFLTRNMKVLVYGEWPGQSRNVLPFFTASFPEKAILKVQEKRFEDPYIFLFVGNLVPGKGLKMALKMIAELQRKGVECRMGIYGDGPERRAAESYIEEARIKGIEFMGNRTLEELEEAYQRGHFVILPSRSEGWPKAVAEGMFFGCIPVVTGVSCVPWMLGFTPPRPPFLRGGGCERGILMEGDVEMDVEWILEVLSERERMRGISKAAKEWSQRYTLERFQEGIREVLKGAPADGADFAGFSQIKKQV